MNRVVLLLIGLGMVAVVAEGASREAASEGWTMADVMSVRRIPEVALAPDGKRVAYVVEEADVANDRWQRSLIVEGLQGGDGARIVVASGAGLRGLTWSPSSSSLAFLEEIEDSTALRVFSVEDGALRVERTDLGETSELAWSPDGRSMALVRPVADPDSGPVVSHHSGESRGPRRHLFVLAIGEEGAALRQLTSGPFSVASLFAEPSLSWSPDATRIAFSHSPTAAMRDWPGSDISVVAVDTGRIHPVASSTAAEHSPSFSPDGRWLAYTISEDPPSWAFSWRVHVASVGNGWRSRPLAPTHDERPVIVGWSGAEVIVREAFGIVRGLAALPLDGSAPRRLDGGELDIGSPSLDGAGGSIAFVGEDVDQAPEVFVGRLAPFRARRLSRIQTLPEAPLGSTRVVDWESPDGTRIEGLLSLPPGDRDGGALPLVVLLHGGPADVFTRSFVGTPPGSYPYPVPVLTGRGIAVLRPNVRGSSGYGKPFRYAIREDWGGVDLQDLLAGVDALVDRGIADPRRLGIAGWSYGGYLTAWAITRTDRFAAASVGAGITDLVSFELTSDIPGFVTDYLRGAPWERSELWRERSPLTHVAGVTTPTLFQHNTGDPRVPSSQARMLFRALEMQDVPATLSLYPGPGHTVRSPAAVVRAMEENLEWFERWLGVATRDHESDSRPIRRALP